MKHKIGKIIGSAVFMLLVAQPASADIVFCGQRSGDTNPCTFDDLFRLIYLIVNMVISAAGLIAVLFIVIGGARMILANGDTGTIKAAKDTMRDAVIGLIIIMMSYLIIGYVVSLMLPGLGADPIRAIIEFIR